MRKSVISAAAIAIVGAGAFAVAQTQPAPSGGFAAPAWQDGAQPAMAGMLASAEDRAVLLDARIGAIKATLKLTPGQEKLWGPLEAVMRKRAADHGEEAKRMRARMQEADGNRGEFDPIARMRARAQHMAAQAQSLQAFADAAQPLYATLDATQKRRIALLMHRARGGIMGRAREGRGGRGHER